MLNLVEEIREAEALAPSGDAVVIWNITAQR